MVLGREGSREGSREGDGRVDWARKIRRPQKWEGTREEEYGGKSWISGHRETWMVGRRC